MGFKIVYNVHGANFHMYLDNVYICRDEQSEELIIKQFKTFRTKQLDDQDIKTLEILSNEEYKGKIEGIIKVLKQALTTKIGASNLDEKKKPDILTMISMFKMTGGRRITDP